jgi:predicted RNase H-like nuclease
LNGAVAVVAVLGVDGCRAGWVGALLPAAPVEVLVAARMEALVESARCARPDLAVVAVDMPIGLPDGAPRVADLLARRRLPPGRKSSVFPAPTRLATAAATHVEASAANRGATGGSGLSIQAFHLVPKILEVDAYVRADHGLVVVEAHPEVSFAAMDPDSVVPAKRTAAGSLARTAALRSAGLEPPAYASGQGYARDDLLDACAVAWTALRVARGQADTLPDPPEVFSDGLPAAIWV